MMIVSSDELKLWIPWIAVAVVALIVIVIIAVNSGVEVGDSIQRCQSIRMVYNARIDACVEGVPVP